jgi:hypothetical protein
MNQSLYKVTFNYQSYNEKNVPIEKTRELFLDSINPEVNTYRLGGFEGATISNVKTEMMRQKHPIEIELDIERNEIEATICGETFLESTLNINEELNKISMDEETIIEHLENNGYQEVCHDNTYNRDTDLDETYDFKVFELVDGGPDWYYSDTAIILVRKHVGLDVRSGYEYLGAFTGLSCDGLSSFLDVEVQFTVVDRLGSEVDQYDSSYQLTNDYKLIDSSDGTIELEREGNTFFATYYNPVYGV